MKNSNVLAKLISKDRMIEPHSKTRFEQKFDYDIKIESEGTKRGVTSIEVITRPFEPEETEKMIIMLRDLRQSLVEAKEATTGKNFSGILGSSKYFTPVEIAHPVSIKNTDYSKDSIYVQTNLGVPLSEISSDLNGLKITDFNKGQHGDRWALIDLRTVDECVKEFMKGFFEPSKDKDKIKDKIQSIDKTSIDKIHSILFQAVYQNEFYTRYSENYPVDSNTPKNKDGTFKRKAMIPTTNFPGQEDIKHKFYTHIKASTADEMLYNLNEAERDYFLKALLQPDCRKEFEGCIVKNFHDVKFKLNSIVKKFAGLCFDNLVYNLNEIKSVGIHDVSPQKKKDDASRLLIHDVPRVGKDGLPLLKPDVEDGYENVVIELRRASNPINHKFAEMMNANDNFLHLYSDLRKEISANFSFELPEPKLLQSISAYRTILPPINSKTNIVNRINVRAGKAPIITNAKFRGPRFRHIKQSVARCNLSSKIGQEQKVTTPVSIRVSNQFKNKIHETPVNGSQASKQKISFNQFKELVKIEESTKKIHVPSRADRGSRAPRPHGSVKQNK